MWIDHIPQEVELELEWQEKEFIELSEVMHSVHSVFFHPGPQNVWSFA